MLLEKAIIPVCDSSLIKSEHLGVELSFFPMFNPLAFTTNKAVKFCI